MTLYIVLTRLIGTIVIELLLGIIIGIKEKKDLFNVVLANIITNPPLVFLVFFLRISFGSNTALIIQIVLEVLIVFIEASIYKKYLKFNRINPLFISFILNLSSYLVGVLLTFTNF